MKIRIIDLRINNLSSLVRAIESIDLGLQIEIVADLPKDFSEKNLLILPGVGNFGAAMESMNLRKIDKHIKSHLEMGGRIVGICLGMQLLLSQSDESHGVSGLAIIEGSVNKLNHKNDRVPNVGWNELSYKKDLDILSYVNQESSFYFTHSFFANVSQDFVVATSFHGVHEFPAVIANQTAIGIQFHPEKSGTDGKQFLKWSIEKSLN